jgi:hypothetical protein
MEWLYVWLPMLGCAAMMFVMMRMMGGKGSNEGPERSDASDHDAASLRARVTELENRLEAEHRVGSDGHGGQ